MQGYVVQISVAKPNKDFEVQDVFAVRKMARGSFLSFCKIISERDQLSQILRYLILNNAKEIYGGLRKCGHYCWIRHNTSYSVKIQVWDADIF